MEGHKIKCDKESTQKFHPVTDNQSVNVSDNVARHHHVIVPSGQNLAEHSSLRYLPCTKENDFALTYGLFIRLKRKVTSRHTFRSNKLVTFYAALK